MRCPFRNDQGDQQCFKQVGKCFLGIFLAILGVAVGLKIIALILCILPGSCHGNIWLVVVAAIIVIVAAKYHKNNSCCCGPNCNCDENCPCRKNQSNSECCEKKETEIKE